MESFQDINEDDFRTSGWEQVIAECEEKECSSYTSCFAAKVVEAEHTGDRKTLQIFRLLIAATSLFPNLHRPIQPYGPMMETNGRQTAILDDFDETHLDFLSRIVGEVTDSELQARLADILFIRKRDFKMIQLAVPAYLESAKRLEDPEHWPATADRIQRALQLAASSGKKGPLFATVIQHIETVLARYDGEDPLFLSARLMEFLQEQNVGDKAANIIRAEKAAFRAESNHDWHRAREYWQIKARWHQLDKDEQQGRAMQVRAAETYVRESEAALERQPPSYLTAAAHLQQAIEAYRRIGNTKERADELHKMLLDYQQRGMAELIPLSTSVDITELTEWAAAQITGKSLPDALARIATIAEPSRMASLRAQAQEAKQKYVFQSLLPRVFLNPMGRIIERQPQNEEESLLADMFMYASSLQNISVQALIEPARVQFLMEHYVRLNDFSWLLSDNPLIRPGRERIVARGLYEGLQGDFLTAAHFLIPQLEDSVRYILSHLGVISSGLDDDGIQDEYNLNRTITAVQFREPLEASFGEDLIFDLRGLLVERFGANLRNDMAHGLISHDAFYSSATRYLWWLSLRFYSLPAIAQLRHNEAEDEPPSDEIDTNSADG